jgi:hypothetical protein
MTAREVNDRPATRRRAEARYFCELLGVCGFAIAAPTLGAFAESPETFVFGGFEGVEIVLFGVAVVLVPPVVAWVPGFVVGLFASPTARRGVHAGTLGLVSVAFASYALRETTALRDIPLVTVSVMIGIAVTALYLRAPVGRDLALLTVFAPLLAFGQFVFFSPVTSLVLPAPDREEAEDAPTAPIVVVVFDELQTQALLDAEGDLDEQAYPGFARLASESTWYRNATTVAGVTTRAVPALLTGEYVDDGVAPVEREHPHNLFTWLADSHEMHADELVTRLCPTDVCAPRDGSGMGALAGDALEIWWQQARPSGPDAPDTEQFEESRRAVDADRLPGGDDNWTGPPNPPARWAQFVDGFSVGRGPALHFLHLTLPHHPFVYHPSGEQYATEEHGVPGRAFDDWLDAPYAVEVARMRYVLQLRYLDGLIHHMISELERTGLWDDALVVVTADHGIGFTPGAPVRGLDDRTLEEIAWVPLFMKAPGQHEGQLDDANVESIDVLPTIADLLGVPLPWPVDGRSAASAPRTTTEKTYLLSEPFEEPRTTADGRLVLDGVEGLARVRDARPVGRSVPTDDELAMYRVGERAELIGEPIDAFTSEPRGSGARLYGGAARFDDVDVRAGTAPAVLHALLDVPDAERSPTGREVLVALNGRVAAVGQSFNDFEGEAFGAMLPLELFDEGRNEVRIFEVVGTAGGITLREFEVEREGG